ncbi:MAG: anti-sigma regulatory factor [Chloroflexi bacterium]|nr:anti-sigma regulatory factor [Chloroflexota bacterium]
MSQQQISIRSGQDVVTVRVRGKELARNLGFGVLDQARVATAVSELAQNVVLHAGAGEVTLRRIQVSGRVGLEAVYVDQGPGIPDVARAMQPGFSTANRPGQGLPGVQRLVDEFEIESPPGQGTRVTIRKWLRAPQ